LTILFRPCSKCIVYFFADYSNDDHLGCASSFEETWERRLQQIRHKHNLCPSGSERKFGMPLFSHSPVPECDRGFRLTNPYAYELKLPFLPDLVRKLAEQRMDMERHNHSSHPSLPDLSMFGSSHSSAPPPGLLSPQSAVKLKIPSYKPMRSYNNNSLSPNNHNNSESYQSPDAPSSQPSTPTAKIGETLKDIIAKTIAEKVRSRAASAYGIHFGRDQSSEETAQERKNGNKCDSEDEPVTKKPKVEEENSNDQENSEESKSGSSGNSDVKVKKTRPKRGQYRKYNSQLLMEAVKAVQRGEMSVHRAGSYFGVPHSTLEYKVKERHLLRQKKPREPRGKKAAQTSQAEGSRPSKSATSNMSDTSSSAGSSGSEDTPSSSTLTTPKVTPPSVSSSGSKPGNSSPSVTEAAKSSSMLASASSSLAAASMAGLESSLFSSLLHNPPGLHSPYSLSAAANHLPLSLAWSQATPPLLPLSSAAMLAYDASNYCLNTSASDLLKKLQRKVQAQTSTVDPEDVGPLLQQMARPLSASPSPGVESPQVKVQ
jgi:hypothetical protein